MNSKFLSFFAVVMVAVVQVNCQDRRVGGVSQVDPDRFDEVVQLLDENIHLLEKDALKIVNITEITEQIVAGKLYRFTGIFEDENGEIFSCEISLVERAWLEHPDKIELKMVRKESLTKDGNADPLRDEAPKETTKSTPSGTTGTKNNIISTVLLVLAVALFGLCL